MRSLFVITVLLCGVLPAASPAFADPLPFTADKIESFNGRSWGGLILGVTTQDGVKRQFRNGRGEYSTSVEVKQENDSSIPYRVSALYINKDKNATLDGICIRYKNEVEGIPLSKLQAVLDGPGEVLYPERRYENWKIVSYARRGILLFVFNERVVQLLLGFPDRVRNTLPLLRDRASAIENYEDQFRSRERVLAFANTDVTFDLKKIRLDNPRREERDLERDMERVSSRALHFDSSASTGSYRVSVTAHYDYDKDKDGTVTASLSGTGPFGPLSTSKSVTFRLYKGEDDMRLEDTRYYRAVTEAMRTVERDMTVLVERQQPPPVETVRRADWDKLIDKYRFHSKSGSGSLVD
ncbi:MAG: hypothetical protein H7Z41_10365 [Cytophagales bacterium]|nr:hypothetical protein [Armatimonadota bacterium]